MPAKQNTDLPRGIYLLPSNNKIHCIQYTDALGRRRREKAGTYRMAENLLLQRHIDRLRRKMPGGHNRVGLKVSDLIDDAINYAFANNDEMSSRDLKGKLERIRADFGTRDAALVERSEISAWLDKQMVERKWRPASRNRYQSAFSLIFRLAVDAGKLDVNPTTGIKGKREDNGRLRFLSKEEETCLTQAIREIGPEHLPTLMLSLHTGMRLSEQARAQVCDYNPDTGMLMVRQTKNRRGPSFRYVPMTPLAVEAYNQLAEGKESGSALCAESLDNARKWFQPSLEKAGIADYTWHSNRHTFCSRMVMTGVPIAAVAQYAGHSNISTTMRYSHLTPGVNTQAAEKMMSFYE